MSLPVARFILFALACGLCWSICAAVDALALTPLRQQEERTTDLRRELASLMDRTSKAQGDLKRGAHEDAATAPARLAMTSASLESTSVAMQENARNALARSGGVPVSSQASAAGGKVTILVRARFSELGLLSFVRAMESSDPPMLVESFELSTLPGMAGTPLEFTGTLIGFHTDAL